MFCSTLKKNSLYACLATVAFACLSTASCSGEENGEEEEGSPTGSTCPSGSMLTYESFGQPFMQEYCVRCHSSALTGTARNGAPLGHDFDTLPGILLVAEHIDERAAGGPNAINEAMPPSGAMPTNQERIQLGEWLACEVAGGAGDGGAMPSDGG